MAKLIENWDELREELGKLHNFHKSALDCIGDLLRAAVEQNNALLQDALTRHAGLSSLVRPPFTVSKALWSGEAKPAEGRVERLPPKLRLVN